MAFGEMRNDYDLGGWLNIFLHNLAVLAYLILGGVTLGALNMSNLIINGLTHVG